MKIWLIHPSDAIPGEKWGYPHATTVGKLLSDAGHEVVWWTANFAHATKQFRSKSYEEIQVSSLFKIMLVPVTGYRKHLSLSRLMSVISFAWSFYRRARIQSPPDWMIVSLPAPGADLAAAILAKRFQAKLIADLRDLWPELFLLAFPKKMHGLAKLLLLPFYFARSLALRSAHKVTAVCSSYLDIALKTASHLGKSDSRIIHCGADVSAFRKFMQCPQPNASPPKNEIRAIYAGTLGNNYDIPTLLQAALHLRDKSKGNYLKILVAGDGPLRQYLVDFVSEHQLDNIEYLGVLSLNELCRYYRISDIALSLYAKGSTVTYPAKAFDFYAAGLPVVNSARGDFERFLAQEQVGIFYEAGNSRSLAAALMNLATDSDMRQLMSRNSFNLAEQFDRKKQYMQLLELIA